MRGPITDAELLGLAGTVLEAGTSRYVLGEVIGEGAHGVVFRAQRGAEVVVVKVLRPRALRSSSGLAVAALQKEVAALERLSALATPHVLRFYDAGLLRMADSALELPWVATEYVEGGEQGVTLAKRVDVSIAATGYAFSPARSMRCLRDLCAGLSTIHDLGMIHRDVAPSNVLCSGSGDAECFKVADFGLARVSSAATFGNVLLGTPGYCAPEQSFPDEVGPGPPTDVFAAACTLFYALTGERYFEAQSIPETLVAVYAPERRSLLEAARTHPDLRARPEICREIDRTLALATRPSAGERIQSAALFAESLVLVLSSPPVT